MRAWLLLPVLVALSACQSYNFFNNCADTYVRPDWAALKQQYAQNRALWEGKAPANYAFTWRQVSWTPPYTLRIVVENKAVKSVTQLEPNQPAARLEEGFTIEKLFDNIAATVSGQGRCETLSVTYDPGLGFPVDSGWSDQTKGLADALGGYEVTSFSSN